MTVTSQTDRMLGNSVNGSIRMTSTVIAEIGTVEESHVIAEETRSVAAEVFLINYHIWRELIKFDVWRAMVHR